MSAPSGAAASSGPPSTSRRGAGVVGRMTGGQIDRATVTKASHDFEGGITVGGDLLDAAGTIEHEEVAGWHVTYGERPSTCTMT